MKRKFLFFISLAIVGFSTFALPRQSEAAGLSSVGSLLTPIVSTLLPSPIAEPVGSLVTPIVEPVGSLVTPIAEPVGSLVTPIAKPGPAKMLPPIPDGAIILGAKPYTPSIYKDLYGYFAHCSIYDAETNTFISAMPGDGVRREDPSYWTTSYEDVAIITVNNVNKQQLQSITQEAQTYLGQPYAFTAKSDLNSWYCSKIPWFLYYKWANIDLDQGDDYFVTPDDLFNDDDVTLYWRG
jgi:hypothetical protein